MANGQGTELNYAALFNLFSSWGYERAEDGASLKQILDVAGDIEQCRKSPTYKILYDAVTRDSALGETRVYGQSWHDKDTYVSETRACVFKTKSENYYVSYSGTGDQGWIDNAQGVTQVSTRQQEEAAKYFDNMARKLGLKESDNVIITGHSKGGNKAQYTTIMSENGHLIDTCYSMDGQGFSPEAIAAFKEKYGEENYRQILDKMHAINGNNDYVSPLLCPIIPQENTTYLETTVSPSDGIGEELIGYHELKNFFQQKDGEYVSDLVPSTDKKGAMGQLAVELSSYLMALPKEERAAAAMVIMQLLECALGNTNPITGEMDINSLVGIDGQHLTFDETITFLTKNLIPILGQIIKSPAGRKVLADILKKALEGELKKIISSLTPIIIFLSPIIKLLVGKQELENIMKQISDLLKTLGDKFKKALEAFQSFMDYIGDIGKDLMQWMKGTNNSSDCSSFEVNLMALRQLEAELSNEQIKLEEEARCIRELRRKIDFGILIRQALYFRITANARELERRASELRSMRKALERCQNVYHRNETRILSRYEGVRV